MAVFHHADITASDHVLIDPDLGHVVSGLPRNPFAYVGAVTNNLQHVLRSGRYLYDESLVNRYDINSVPLKIDIKKFPEMDRYVTHTINSTSTVFPVRLIDANIGSNVGLLAVLKQICEERGIYNEQLPPTRYTIMNVDENIFWRILKVCILD
jgi:hypothetical protein